MICRNIVQICEKNHHSFTANENFILNIVMFRENTRKKRKAALQFSVLIQQREVYD